MEQALQLALEAQQAGEVPVGAVLVSADNKLLSSAFNKTIGHCDPTAHAEVLALRKAAEKLGNHRLKGCTLYVTLEPCAMCAGALVQARVRRLVFGCRDFKAGAAGSVYNLLKGYPLNHQVIIDEGIFYQQCASLLTDFFEQRR